MVPTLQETRGVKGHRPVAGTRDYKDLRHIGRVYPPEQHPEVVLMIDNAPWHAGRPVAEALAMNPHLRLTRKSLSRGFHLPWRYHFRSSLVHTRSIVGSELSQVSEDMYFGAGPTPRA